jgi:hypothetical protein
MVFVGFLSVLLLSCVSLFGWGALINRLTKHPVRNPVVVLSVGLGALIFLGGVLNLLRLAYGWALDGLILGGILLAVYFRKSRPSLPRNRNERFYITALGLVITLIMGFTISTQLPPGAYNFHDDYEKYFSHPVRMLQTGTLFGSSLTAIGIQTLGGQALLQGIILNHFPIPYINGMDAVFGLLLCLILPVSIVPLRLTFLPISLLGLLLVFFICPQYVNVSALYTGSAFMMASILLFSGNDETIGGAKNNLPPSIIAGLLAAALVSLKSSFLLFPALQGAFFCIALALFGTDLRRIARWGLSTGLLTLFFLSPWLLLHLPHYLRWSSAAAQSAVLVSSDEVLNLFSLDPLFYGASFAHYTVVALSTVISSLAIFLWKLITREPSKSVYFAGVAASGAAIFLSWLFLVKLGSGLVDYSVNLRYTIPFLIAGAPAVITLSCVLAAGEASAKLKTFLVAAMLLLELLIIAGFSENLMMRIRQASKSGNILAFSDLAARPDFLEYNKEVLYGDTALRIAEAQKQVPAGPTLVTWVMTPFYLDFKRNVIYDVDPSGLDSPWTSMPPEAEYFMIEYAGFAVRPVAAYYENLQYAGRQSAAQSCLDFLANVWTLRKDAEVLYDDGRIIVFKANKKP